MPPRHDAHAPGDGDHLEPLLVNLQRYALDTTDDELRSKAEQLAQRAERVRAEDRERLELEVRRFCYQRNLPQVLALSGVPSVYNFREPLETNASGPWDRFPEPVAVSPDRRWRVLGHDLGFPLGVPASVLTSNYRFTEYYARKGFNVLTTKSVRSLERPELPFPNWVHLQDLDRPFELGGLPDDAVVGDEDTYFSDPRAFSTANSFGVPSPEPRVWQHDIATTLERLGDGKLLIASVMGSSEVFRSEDELRDDFVTVARLAEDVGVTVIELNLSCPNTIDANGDGVKPPLCHNLDVTARIVEAVREGLQDASTRLVAKLSFLPASPLGDLLGRIAPVLDGVTGINTIQLPVVRPDGRPTFPGRPEAGVSGIAIREYALDFVRNTASLRRQHGWDLDIIGVGGVMTASDVRALMNAGADVVQTATAASQNPALPSQLAEPRELSSSAVRVLGTLEERPEADEVRIASTALLPLSAVRAALSELAEEGLVDGVPAGADRCRWTVNRKALAKQLAR